MAEKQQELAKIILADPAVESLSSFIGADGTNTTLNSGRMSINLKPLYERSISAANLVRRLQSSLQKVQGILSTCSPCKTSRWTTASAGLSINTRSKIRTPTN